MSLKERIVSDLTAAMKAKEAARLSTLRMVKANVMNREIEKGGELTEEEMTRALQSLVKQRRDSVEQYEKAGRGGVGAKGGARSALLEGDLPPAAPRAGVQEAGPGGPAPVGASSPEKT